jgi:hypothetical protein
MAHRHRQGIATLIGDKADDSAELRRGLKEPGQSFRTAATEGSHSASASAFKGNDENAFDRLKGPQAYRHAP